MGTGRSAKWARPTVRIEAAPSRVRSKQAPLGPVRFDALPESTQARFLHERGGKVDYWDWFVDGRSSPLPQAWRGVVAVDPGVHTSRVRWLREGIDAWVERARMRDPSLPCPYEGAPEQFYRLLDEVEVLGREVAVVGSISPWIEAILLSRGARVTSVDFNPVVSEHPAVRCLGRPQFLALGPEFDAVFSYSSIEHDGLSRYGDPIDPDGDLCAMDELSARVASSGVLYLAVPMHHHDALRFNADRLYGPVRFERLLQGWQVLGQTPDPVDGVRRSVPDYWESWRAAFGGAQKGRRFTAEGDSGIRHERGEHPIWWLGRDR